VIDRHLRRGWKTAAQIPAKAEHVARYYGNIYRILPSPNGSHYDPAVQDKVQLPKESLVVGNEIGIHLHARPEKQVVADDAWTRCAVKRIGNRRHDLQCPFARVVIRFLEADMLDIDVPDDPPLVGLALLNSRLVNNGIAGNCDRSQPCAQYPTRKVFVGDQGVDTLLGKPENGYQTTHQGEK